MSKCKYRMLKKYDYCNLRTLVHIRSNVHTKNDFNEKTNAVLKCNLLLTLDFEMNVYSCRKILC